ncbi:MAG: BMP family ABC transporter substrate-binding protein [Oscillospiraceae bacterium]|nr:BMP family ABC transporter substrate-binding protein [Oscillospiraceae bacterium]
MKRYLSLILAAVMVLGLLAGCGGNGGSETKPAEGGEAVYKVAMITDYCDITDQSFNQTSYEGCIAYCDPAGVEFNYFKPLQDADAERIAMVDAAVSQGYNIIVTPGYAFAPTIIATAEMYPDVKFIALDVSAADFGDWTIPANVYSAIYQEELCGYMAGYAAVKMGYKHVGFMGGMAVPAVVRYGYGFVQGVDAAAKELGIENEVVLDYIYANAFNGDADITAVMDTWYQEMGVEIVFSCAAGAYTSVAEAAAKVGGKLIGVDVDQKAIVDSTYGEGMCVTSAMKGLAATIEVTLKDVIENGNWEKYSGKIETLGVVSAEDPASNFVQIPYESTLWNDTFTQADYQAVLAGILDGSIVVSNDTTTMPTTAIVINTYANIK